MIVVAILAFTAWSVWRPEPRMAFGLIAAVSVLIIAALAMALSSISVILNAVPLRGAKL